MSHRRSFPAVRSDTWRATGLAIVLAVHGAAAWAAEAERLRCEGREACPPAVGTGLGTWPILAFHQPSTGDHRYTASPAERISLTKDKDAPWVFVEVLGWTDMTDAP